MGQAEVEEFLKEVNEPVPARDIAFGLDERIGKVIKILSKMIEHGEIDFVELDRKEAMKKYRSKRKMRLYFLYKVI